MKSMVLYNRPVSCLHPFDNFSLYDALTAFDPHPLQETVQKYAQQYRIELQIPGMKKKDLFIRVEGDALIIEGRQKEEKKHRYRESSFTRRIHLWEDMDVDGIKAKHKNGVLTVRIPRKKELSTYREIPVIGSHDESDSVVTDHSNASWLTQVRDKVQSWFKKVA